MRAVFLSLLSGQCGRHWHVAAFMKRVVMELRRGMESLQTLQVGTLQACGSRRGMLLAGADTCAVY